MAVNMVGTSLLPLLQYILHRTIYCSVLCEPELDRWNVNVDKLLFLHENLRQLIYLLVVLIITTSVLQYSNIL